MQTRLMTIYFWGFVILNVLPALYLLFAPIVALQTAPLSGGELWGTTLITTVLVFVLFMPFYVLQLKGVKVLGLPAWLVYAQIALYTIYTFMSTLRNVDGLDRPVVLELLGLAIAWKGLEGMKAEADANEQRKALEHDW